MLGLYGAATHLAGLIHLLLQVLQLQLEIRYTGTLLGFIGQQKLSLHNKSGRDPHSQHSLLLDCSDREGPLLDHSA
jgi:hypothetical protein